MWQGSLPHRLEPTTVELYGVTKSCCFCSDSGPNPMHEHSRHALAPNPSQPHCFACQAPTSNASRVSICLRGSLLSLVCPCPPNHLMYSRCLMGVSCSRSRCELAASLPSVPSVPAPSLLRLKGRWCSLSMPLASSGKLN